ncbi:hypothetical protein JQC91_16965 [Jannaschia sp. Os4]|uniref:hypothetical protein n=1 Tax=Jannaschia sp. Os4 TaxID=2807617 RepID=UPI0019397620|nr:hypothetical protein [Jannaschia sp. Os4]MBM2577999.1 hypothetical protein [Jannaschia sp. Os4]
MTYDEIRAAEGLAPEDMAFDRGDDDWEDMGDLDAYDLDGSFDWDDDDDEDWGDEDEGFYDDDDDEAFDDDAPEFIGGLVRNIRRRGRRRVRRGVRRTLRTATGRGYVTSRQIRGLVTRAELAKSLGKVRVDVRRNGAAIRTTDEAIKANARRIGTLARVDKVQTKAIDKMRADMASQAQMQMLFSLMDGGTKTYTVQAGSDFGVGKEVKLSEKGDMLSKLLPLLMSGGLGGKDGGGMGFDNPLMLLVFADAIKGGD